MLLIWSDKLISTIVLHCGCYMQKLMQFCMTSILDVQLIQSLQKELQYFTLHCKLLQPSWLWYTCQCHLNIHCKYLNCNFYILHLCQKYTNSTFCIPMRYFMTLYIKLYQKYDRSKLRILLLLSEFRCVNFYLSFFWCPFRYKVIK